MDFKDLAKFAAAKKKSSITSPEEQIERLKKTVAREKAARRQAEETIEKSSRRLYLANQEAAALNKELESTLRELNETLGALTSAKAQRIATMVTLFTATILFFISEFLFEPVLEAKIENGFFLVIAKGLIFAILIPVEIIGSRLAERNLTESGKINQSLYRDLLIAAYEDDVITDMERNLLNSSARQLGINSTIAKRLEQEIIEQRGGTAERTESE